MADNLKMRPKKGILKNSSSFETTERHKEFDKETKWDEMNIIATFHPKDKDYGHMKIEEPKTPFSYETHESGDEIDAVDAELLSQKIKLSGNEPPKAMNESDESSETEELETDEEKLKRKFFEMKRKEHYNEFAAVKLARKLMEQDSDDEMMEATSSSNSNNRIDEEELEEEEEQIELETTRERKIDKDGL